MKLSMAVQPALWAIRVWWKLTALITFVGCLATGAILAVTTLGAWHDGALAARMLPPPMETVAVQPTSSIVIPLNALRYEALTILFHLLAAIAAGVLLVTTLTILAAAEARSSLRVNEVATRRAVGASLRHLRSAAMVEGGFMGTAIVGIGGLFASSVAAHVATKSWPGQISSGTVDLTLMVVAAIFAATFLGIFLPSLFLRSRAPVLPTAGSSPELFIPALQLGLSLAVLTTSSLVARHARPLLGQIAKPRSVGHVFQATISDSSEDHRAHAYERMLSSQLKPLAPGLILSSPGALLGLGTEDVVVTQCGNCFFGGFFTPWRIDYAVEYVVSSNALAQLGLRTIAGRLPSDDDAWRADPTVVISESLATLFEGSKAVGKKLKVGHGDWYTVVGVVANQRPIGFGSGVMSPNAIYFSVLRDPPMSVEILVGKHDNGEDAANLGKYLGSMLPPGSRLTATTTTQLLDREEAPLIWFSRFFSLEGWVMMTIAFLGTFTIMHVWVESVLYELGVRIALGARRYRMVLWVSVRALAVAMGGLLIGLWFGLIFWGSLPSAISGVASWDPQAVFGFASLLAVGCFLGAVVPAWRKTARPPAEIIGGYEQ